MARLTKREIKRLDAYYRRTYGITWVQYQAMFRLQRKRCAICKTFPKTRRLHVDHDHKSGVVRGLLCFRCNKLLVGKHTAESARLICAYLERDFDGRKIQTPTVKAKAGTAATVRRGRTEMHQVRQELLPPTVD